MATIVISVTCAPPVLNKAGFIFGSACPCVSLSLSMQNLKNYPSKIEVT